MYSSKITIVQALTVQTIKTNVKYRTYKYYFNLIIAAYTSKINTQQSEEHSLVKEFKDVPAHMSSN